MLCSALAVAGMFGFLAASPFVYIQFYGVSEPMYGVLFALNILVLISMTGVSNRLVARQGSRCMLGMAMGMILVSSLMLAAVALMAAPPLLLLVVAVMLFIGTAGVISANAMALVLERLGPISGSASAVAGSLRFGLGALAPVAVAALFDGTPLALALVLAVCGLACCRRRRGSLRAGRERGKRGSGNGQRGETGAGWLPSAGSVADAGGTLAGNATEERARAQAHAAGVLAAIGGEVLAVGTSSIESGDGVAINAHDLGVDVAGQSAQRNEAIGRAGGGDVEGRPGRIVQRRQPLVLLVEFAVDALGSVRVV